MRYCRVGSRRRDDVARFIDRYHELWDARFSALDRVLEQMKERDTHDANNTRG